MTFKEWQAYATAIDARAHAVDESIHNRGWKLAASVGIPRDGCCLHNASVDDEMTGWCHRNPERLRVAKQANYLTGLWPATRITESLIAKAYRRIAF